MPVERLALPNGDWVDLVTRLNHAQMRRIRTAARSEDLDSLTEGIAAMAANWSLRDVDGAEIPFPGAGPDGVAAPALDRIPADVTTVIGKRATELAAGGPDPNGLTARSGDSPPEPPSG